MANDYTQTPLVDQQKIMAQEEKNWRLFSAKARMWQSALTELNQSGQVIGQETDELEPSWKDTAGTEFVTRARNTKRVIDQWAHNIETAKPQEPLEKLPEAIRTAKATVDANVVAFEKYWAQLQAPGMSREQAEIPFRKPGGTQMNTVAELYEQAATAVEKATAGGPYEGVNTVPQQKKPPTNQNLTGGGGVPTGGLPTGGGPNASIDGQTAPTTPQTGPSAVDNMGPSAPTGGDPTGLTQQGGPSSPGQNANPELSGGLGGAPSAPPTLPQTGGVGGGPIPPAGGTGLPGGGTGLTGPVPGPVGGSGGLGTIPPVGPVTGAGGSTGTRPGSGGGLGSGVKLPGVSLGGGSGIGPVGGGGIGPIGGGGGVGGSGSTIPAAAAPYHAPASPAPSGADPAAPPSVAASSGGAPATGGGMGGMPPMMPPGAMGAGGGPGSGPGSGAAARPGNNRNRRKEIVTPGLPVVLSGKAGMADMNAFAGRGRKQLAESDVPTTVQLIDEDLWQVEQKPAADERVAAPVRRAH